MSNDSIIIDSYARALFDECEGQKITKKIQEELKRVCSYLGSSSEVFSSITSPNLAQKQRLEIVNKIAETLKLHPLTANFMKLLVKNTRIELIQNVNNRFEVIINEAGNIITGKIISARAMSKTDLASLTKLLEEQIGKECKLEHNIDPEIKGGVVIKTENWMLDASISGALQNSRKITRNIS